MNEMKYVMYEDDTFIMIPQFMNHSDISMNNKPIHSAGFLMFFHEVNKFEEDIITVDCSGKSFTLNKTVDKEHDEIIINSSLRI